MKIQYRDYWSKKRFQPFLEMILFFPISVMARFIPKKDIEIYGSMNGFKICDNSKFLFDHTSSDNSFFITKNKEISLENRDRVVYAYSLKGFYLQLLAKKIYWTHGLNDFIPSLVVGAYIVGLQHGLPGKKGGNANLSKINIFNYKIKNKLVPFCNIYFCHEVWSPKKVYDSCMKEVFYPSDTIIVRKQIPRIEFQPKLPRKRKILYAPSHRGFRSLSDVISANNIFSVDFLRKLNENNFELILRPHPISYEELKKSDIDIPVKIDLSDDVHDSIASYSVVISDFSGLLIDCWELDIDTYCLCDDLEDVFERDMLFDWFYQRLNSVRIFDILEVLKNPVISCEAGSVNSRVLKSEI
ncbi:CDP-glycerol glycerophosphotransferase family protein [Methylophilaceae bacterium]|nr:CDP-glycerol glycerophosphotransferase family protein [Methylophilaceae bacterium]